jgi:hypothetical protein
MTTSVRGSQRFLAPVTFGAAVVAAALTVTTLTTSGDVSVGDDLTVTGTSDLRDDVTVGTVEDSDTDVEVAADLTVTGSQLVTGVLAVTGEAQLDGGIVSEGDLAVEDISAETFTVDPPSVGGATVVAQSWDSGVVSISTSGATTTIPLSVPAGTRIDGVSLYISPVASGIDSTEMDFDFTGGSTLKFIDNATPPASPFAFSSWLGPTSDGRVTSSAANATLTFAGGADNTASAGSVRLVVHGVTISSPTLP